MTDASKITVAIAARRTADETMALVALPALKVAWSTGCSTGAHSAVFPNAVDVSAFNVITKA